MTFPLWAWAGFVAFVIAMVALDLFVLHREAHEVSMREAGMWTGIWIALALAFWGLLWAWRGGSSADAYLSGYLIEKSLSVDNIFVFALIFSKLAIPPRHQHRVLMYGIVGALAMRAGFIAGGAALLDAAHVVIYLFGALLLYTAWKVLRHGPGEVRPERNPALRAVRRIMPSTNRLHEQRFVVREGRRRLATPLMAALILIETTDLVFAVDSIPAIFAVTRNVFVVFTSNVFAVLGMRALYFLLSGAARRLPYLQTSLGTILAGVGVKMLVSDIYKFPNWASLAFVGTVLAIGVTLSLRFPGGEAAGRERP